MVFLSGRCGLTVALATALCNPTPSGLAVNERHKLFWACSHGNGWRDIGELHNKVYSLLKKGKGEYRKWRMATPRLTGLMDRSPKKKEEAMADIDDLAGTFERVVAAINKRDAGAYSGFWHDHIVAFPPFSPFPVDGKVTLRQLAEANFANTESVTFTPINPQCRVVGTTGIVWCFRSGYRDS
jgi:SnoaL-like domain